jgi:hypothetical protein
VLVYNLDFQPEELQVSGRQTLEDLIQQLRVKHPKLTGTTLSLSRTLHTDPPATLYAQPPTTASHSFYLRTDDGEWKLLGAGTPLYLNGLRRYLHPHRHRLSP